MTLPVVELEYCRQCHRLLRTKPTTEDTAILEPETAPAKTNESAWRGIGYAMWSRERRDWCSQHFPNFFDSKTGTIVPYKTGVRTICR